MPAPGRESTDLLVAQAIQGDHRAQSALWRSHRPWLAAVLLAHRPRELDIEDLMQDVAVKFVSKVHTLREVSAFRPWLRRIAINVAREAARSLKTRGDISLSEDGGNVDQAHSASELPGTRDDAKSLLDHARSLPVEFREPLLMRCVQGMTSAQIAGVLDLPQTTIETRLSRARRMLREEWLAQHDPQNPNSPTNTVSTTSALVSPKPARSSSSSTE